MNKALWVVQGLLALAFGMAGFIKVSTPLPELAQQMSFVAHSPGWLVRFIGAAELAGAIGLIVPAATKIKPWLTPLAALGLAVVMVLAFATHALLGELAMTGPNVVLFLLASLVAWGRSAKLPIVAPQTA